jgi:hypothetical protein
VNVKILMKFRQIGIEPRNHVSRDNGVADPLDESLDKLHKATLPQPRRRWIGRKPFAGLPDVDNGKYADLGHPYYDPIDHLIASARNQPSYDAADTLQQEAREVFEKKNPIGEDASDIVSSNKYSLSQKSRFLAAKRGLRLLVGLFSCATSTPASVCVYISKKE